MSRSPSVVASFKSESDPMALSSHDSFASDHGHGGSHASSVPLMKEIRLAEPRYQQAPVARGGHPPDLPSSTAVFPPSLGPSTSSLTNHRLLGSGGGGGGGSETLMHDSFVNMGQKLKTYNDTLAQLHQLGIQHELSLPELVLVGDQSAGKSSLMSGLAGMNLPQSGGVCTRCVIHIHSSRSPELLCRVSLRQKYAFQPPPNGGHITADSVTPAHPFPPWLPQAEKVYEFKTIHDPSSIEEVLRWAQIATLNPSKPFDMFVPDSGIVAQSTPLAQAAESTEASFSPNVVALELRGPHHINLSYYDLPGIFATTPNEKDMYLVNVVENLTRAYIRHPRAIILWACPMNQDPVNSNTLKLIRAMKAQDRTLGVLTKADLLSHDASGHGQWLAMLQGDDIIRTGHGYFVTTRSSKTVNGESKTLEEQNAYEENFFQDSQSWGGDFLAFRHLTGVERLRKRLSSMLCEAFAACMPSIRAKVSQRLQATEQQLAQLPELPHNIELEVNRSLKRFTDTVAQKMAHNSFSSEFQRLCEQFRDCLMEMKPKVVVSDESDWPDVVIELLDDADDDDDRVELTMSSAENDQDRGRNRAVHATSRPPHRSSHHHLPATPQSLFVDEYDGQRTPKRRHPAAAATPVNRAMSQSASPTKRLRLDPSTTTSTTTTTTPTTTASHQTSSFAQQIQARRASPFIGFVSPMRRTIGDIRELIRSKGHAGIPGYVSNEVHQDLAHEAVQSWQAPTLRFLHETMQMVQRIVLHDALAEAFRSLQKRLIAKRARQHMDTFLRQQADEAKVLLLQLFRIHTYRLFTLNKEDFDRMLREEADILTHCRHFHRWRAFTSSTTTPGTGNHNQQSNNNNNTYRPFSLLSDEEKARDFTLRQAQTAKMGKDPFFAEVEVYAYVRSYYRLAAARYADSVAMTVHSDLFPRIVDRLHEDLYLEQALGVLGSSATEAAFRELMEEDVATATLRTRLKDELAKFNQAIASLTRLDADTNEDEEPSWMDHDEALSLSVSDNHFSRNYHNLNPLDTRDQDRDRDSDTSLGWSQDTVHDTRPRKPAMRRNHPSTDSLLSTSSSDTITVTATSFGAPSQHRHVPYHHGPHSPMTISTTIPATATATTANSAAANSSANTLARANSANANVGDATTTVPRRPSAVTPSLVSTASGNLANSMDVDTEDDYI